MVLTAAQRAALTQILDTASDLGYILKGIGDVRLFEATVPRIDRYLKALTRSSGPGIATTARVVLK